MARTPGIRPPAAGLLRDVTRATLAGVASGGLLAAVIVALNLQDSLRGWYGLTPQQPVAVPAGELWLENARTLLWPFAATAAVSWTPRARLFFDVSLTVILGANVLLVAAALAAYGGPLWQLAPGHYVLELLAVVAAAAAYLDARRDGILRPRVIVGCAAVTAVLLAGAALLESGAA